MATGVQGAASGGFGSPETAPACQGGQEATTSETSSVVYPVGSGGCPLTTAFLRVWRLRANARAWPRAVRLLMLAVTAFVAAALASLGGLLLLGDRPAHWLVLDEPLDVVDAVVVLAGDPDYERTQTAVRIMASGYARILILTGGESGPGDHASSLRDVAVRLGVPAERTRMETRSHSTRHALLEVRAILASERIQSVGLVTSPYHQRRAYLVARRAWPGLTIRNFPARPSSWSPEGWLWNRRSRRIVLSEYAKLAWYRLRGWL